MQSATEQSTPDPDAAVIVGAVIRWVLVVLAASGATWAANVRESIIGAVVGIVVAVGGLVWSLWQKKQAAKLDHAGNVASARGGQAVKVVAVK